MATTHAVVRTDNMSGTTDGSQLVSLRYMGADGNTPTAIDNGNVLKIGALITGERELRTGTDVIATTPISEVVLVASEEVMYDDLKSNLDEFENEAGADLRGYRLHSGDIFSITAEGFTSTPEVGNIIELAEGTKFSPVASATDGSTVVGSVIEKEIKGRYTYYVVEVD